ncbi:putative Ig domain-containing protein [Pedococcus sp. KACC 23699]|uniref:Ig domain-containing protein n=1 Tax=Pedococcus sp. KACC 23699 TaxID=3149228 RepID=A0AAU7JTK6_9MICO
MIEPSDSAYHGNLAETFERQRRPRCKTLEGRLMIRTYFVARTVISMLAAGAVTAGGVVLVQQPAAAATSNLTVTTTADVPTTTGACASASTVVAPSPVSLRETVCLANNLAASTGNAVVITVPSGTYTLTYGQLKIGTPANSNISVNGAGAASTTISGGGASRIFDADPNVVGGVNITLTGLTLTGALDNTIGGGAIIGGAQNLTNGDSLTVDSSVITDNHVNTTSPSQTLIGGGGINFAGGSLTITNSTLSNNSSGSSEGSAVSYRAQGHAPNERLTVRNTTFSGNTQVNNSGGTDGGALSVYAPSAAGQFSIINSMFLNNSVTSTLGYSRGAAIITSSGTLTVTGSTFVGNSATGGSQQTGGAIQLIGTASTLRYNRFYKNVATAGSGVHLAGAAAVVATDNWWGCNGGPGAAGCDTVVNISSVPRLVLTGSASPSTVTGPNAASTITTSLLTDSGGLPISAANLGAFANLPIGWSNPRPGDARVSPTTSNLVGAQASTGYNSGTGSGPGGVTATLDNGSLVIALVVDAAPAITSADHVTFSVGVASSFTITTTGYPAPSISRTAALPSGVSFIDHGNGTATISGTPSAGSGGSYPVGLTASNSTATAATQTLTVTVPQAPTFTSAATATFTAGTLGSITVTTTGPPTVTAVSESGTLPTGLSFQDNGDGTAVLSGTPVAGSGGSYPVQLTATNGINPDATQTLTVTVDQAPSVTLDPISQRAAPGDAVTFAATGDGYPAPTVRWQVSADGGLTFTDILTATSTNYTQVATAADTGHQYRAMFSNAVSSVPSAAATLLVGTAPAFTSADHATFSAGTSGSFTVLATGTPAPAITTNDLPGWLTLTDHGDGSATVAGTAPPGSGGTPGFTLHASNGFDPAVSQSFTLTVTEAPGITSADHTMCTVGVAGNFTVTATGGFPTPPALLETGPLPAGITFVDQGDGTATLSGTAPSPAEAGSYPITVTASNGGSESSSQQFLLTVERAPVLALPPTVPASDGPLTGVPAQSTPGQLLLDVSGSGFAPGAPITLGTYSPATVVGHTTADSTGAFHTTLQLPTAAGQDTVLAAGIAPDGTDRYLEAITEIVATPVPTTPVPTTPVPTTPVPTTPVPTTPVPTTPVPTTPVPTTPVPTTAAASSSPASPSSASRGALAFTGLPEDPLKVLGWAAILLLAGLALLASSQRRSRRH